MERLYEIWANNNVTFKKNLEPRDYYLNRGFEDSGISFVIQSVVFVCSEVHREIFEYVYNNYTDDSTPGYNYEMSALLYEILSRRIKLKILEPEINWLVYPILAAFYPNYLISKGLLINLVNKLLFRLRLTQRKRYLASKDEIFAVNQIFSLSYFSHFASCGDRREFLSLK